MKKQILLLILLFYISNVSYSKELVFVTGLGQSSNTKNIETVKQLLAKALNELSIEFSLEYKPGNRSLAELNSGRYDGELYRRAAIQKQYPNLIIVPEPVLEDYVSIYTLDKNMKILNYSDLQDMRVVTILGLKNIEQKLKKVLPKESLFLTVKIENAFKMLLAGRVKVVVLPAKLADSYLGKLNDSKIKKLDTYLDKAELYTFLHRKNSDLIEPLAAAIRKVK